MIIFIFLYISFDIPILLYKKKYNIYNTKIKLIKLDEKIIFKYNKLS